MAITSGMDQSIVFTFAISFLILLCAYIPLLGLVALVYAAYHWVGPFGAVVIALFWVRYGPGLLTWPSWPFVKAP